MPGIRYYDYGVMRRESEQRMFDAQRRSADADVPCRRVRQDYREQMPFTAVSPTEAPACEETVCCSSEETVHDECAAEENCTAKPAQRAAEHCGMPHEELLIAAVLLLTLSEGGDIFLLLALAYLLM